MKKTIYIFQTLGYVFSVAVESKNESIKRKNEKSDGIYREGGGGEWDPPCSCV